MAAKLIQKHLPKRIATAQGHLDQESKNLCTTEINDLEDDIAPGQEPNDIKTNDIICTFSTMDNVFKSYSDQTAKLSITFSRRHKYIFIFYHCNTNTILGIPIKSRTASELCEAWSTVFEVFKS